MHRELALQKKVDSFGLFLQAREVRIFQRSEVVYTGVEENKSKYGGQRIDVLYGERGDR